MNIGALWRKARYAAAEVLFRLGGFVEPKEFQIDFKEIVAAAREANYVAHLHAAGLSFDVLRAPENESRRN